MGTRRTRARGAVRSDALARLATLHAEGQTVYWLAASGRDLSALLQGIVRPGLRAQAIRLLHPARSETSTMYAARRAQEDLGG